MSRTSKRVLESTQTTSETFEAGVSLYVRLEGTVAGSWVVQSARPDADLTVDTNWTSHFRPGACLTPEMPVYFLRGSDQLVFRITGGTAGAEGWISETKDAIRR